MRSYLQRHNKEKQEARDILRAEREANAKAPHVFKNRFPLSEMSAMDRYKVDLMYSLRTEYRSYLDYCGYYTAGIKMSAVEFLEEEVRIICSRNKRTDDMPAILNVLGEFDLGVNGKKGSFNPLLSTVMYDEIVKRLNI
jgi:hypothetical protein